VGQLLEEAQIGFAGRNTAIGDALAIAVKRLRDRPEGSRVLILMTDGANTAGEIPPREAADLAARSGLRVYTIGIGAESMELPGLLGGMFGARRINPSADLDETGRSSRRSTRSSTVSNPWSRTPTRDVR
jgi:Ca-activated chloride channel family protein